MPEPTLEQRIAFLEAENKLLKAAYWEDLRFDVSAVRVPTSNPPSWTTYKGGRVLAFEDQAVEGNEEQITFNVQLPHAWVEGSLVYPHVHWVGEDDTAGNVFWQLTYSWSNIGETFPAVTTLEAAGANGATDEHLVTSLGTMDGSNKGISSAIICNLSRHSSDATDTFNDKDAYLIEVDFHVLLGWRGSRQEFKK